jgi:hypothetical protein
MTLPPTSQAAASVAVPVMDVRVMRMTVSYHRVLVQVVVLADAAPFKFMRVLVVRIVAMQMVMRHRFMDMFVPMLFGQMEPDPQSHQKGGHPEGR